MKITSTSIAGSGIDTDMFKPLPSQMALHHGITARLLSDKGITSLVDAVTELNNTEHNHSAPIAGTQDPANPRLYQR